MRILPAIDLKDQMCVRLVKGDYATAHKVAEDAVETAKKFLDAGAELIHMVDLDGAKDGTHPNYPVVRRVIEETGASVELGGGIRTMEDIARVLELGVKRVIIGSAAASSQPNNISFPASFIALFISVKSSSILSLIHFPGAGECPCSLLQRK